MPIESLGNSIPSTVGAPIDTAPKAAASNTHHIEQATQTDSLLTRAGRFFCRIAAFFLCCGERDLGSHRRSESSDGWNDIAEAARPESTTSSASTDTDWVDIDIHKQAAQPAVHTTAEASNLLPQHKIENIKDQIRPGLNEFRQKIIIGEISYPEIEMNNHRAFSVQYTPLKSPSHLDNAATVRMDFSVTPLKAPDPKYSRVQMHQIAREIQAMLNDFSSDTLDTTLPRPT